MWNIEKNIFKFHLEKLFLFTICLVAAFVSLWHVDEGVISIMIDIFQKTGVARYPFQHDIAPLSFGWPYFYLLGFCQPHPLDPNFYFLTRLPCSMMIFGASLCVQFFIFNQTKNKFLSFISGLFFLYICLKLGIFTGRYDAPYLLGSASILLPLSFIDKNGMLDPSQNSKFVIFFIIAIFLNSFALTTHPNGIGCYGALGLVWLILMRQLSPKMNLMILCAYAISLFISYHGLLVGRTISQFMTDLSAVKNQHHSFDFKESMIREFQKYKSYIREYNFSLKIYPITAILTIFVFFRNPRNFIKQPIYIIFFIEALYLSLQFTKWHQYQALTLPISTIILMTFIFKVFYALKEKFDIQIFFKMFNFQKNINKNAFIKILMSFVFFGLINQINYCLYYDLKNNTLFKYVFRKDSKHIVHLNEVKKKLDGQPLSIYSDCTMIPLFSNMDLSRHRMSQPDPLRYDQPPAPSALGIMIVPVNSWCAKIFYDNHFANEYNFQHEELIHMFGYDWEIVRVTKK